MKVNDILNRLKDKEDRDSRSAEDRFNRIIPLLRGMDWYVIDRNTIICPIDKCKSSILNIVNAGYGRYDDGRGSICLKEDFVEIYYNSHGSENLSFFRNVWGINLLTDLMNG
jgi:hypothetical protein